MRPDNRWWAIVALTSAVLTTAGCTVPVGGPSAATSVAPVAPASSSARPTATGPVVTVPGLGGVPTSTPESAVSSATTPSAGDPVTSEPASSPPSSAVSTTSVAPPASSSLAVPVVPPAATGRTAQVDLSGTCPDCVVISSRAEVLGDLSMAVVSMPGGRTAAMALRPDGSSASILAIPYGVTFPTPADSVLPCDSGGHCLVEATTPDGGVVTALGLGSDGKLVDLSPPDGFVSVGVPAQIVDLDGEPGVAVLEVPGSQPIWTVYGWTGAEYGPVGCTTGSTPDLAALALSLCG